MFDENLIFAGEVIDWCDDENIKIISYFDDSYPESLKTLEVPPAVIFCYGDESLLQKVTCSHCWYKGQLSSWRANNKKNFISVCQTWSTTKRIGKWHR